MTPAEAIAFHGILSIVVPAYNEVDNLRPVLSELIETLDSAGADFEVVVVDDGSSDGTSELADRLAREDSRIRVVHHGVNKGHGVALSTGFAACRGDWITSVPGDGQIDPNDFPVFFAELDGADFVGSYYVDRDDGLKRKVLTKGLRVLLRLLFGPIPRLEGTRFFRRELLDTVRLSSGTSLANLELAIRVHRAGYRLRSVPSHCRARLSGESKVANSNTIAKFLWDIFRLRFIELGIREMGGRSGRQR